jgi:leader peptidase (prepilin peptidase)/N-methyltransferase
MVISLALLGFLLSAIINQLGSDLPAFSISKLEEDGGLTAPSTTRPRLTHPHCKYCGHNRPWWQWLVLPASLVGRARCLSCGKPIGIRHVLVEIGMAATYGYLWIHLGPNIKLPLYLVYFGVFAIILITDFERRLILNIVTYPAIVFAIAATFFTPGMTWQSGLAGGAIAVVFFFIVWLVGDVFFGSGAFGFGDVSLSLFIGLITGFPLVIETIILTIIIGGITTGFLVVTRIRRMNDYIPYGPFIIAGTAITLLWGYAIAEWYLYR